MRKAKAGAHAALLPVALIVVALLAGCVSPAETRSPSGTSTRPSLPAASAAATAPASAPTSESALQLVFIGRQQLPHGYRFEGTTVGGLSGIDFDAATGRYWAISDDRSEFGPSRFYELSLDLSQFAKAANPGHAAVTFHRVITLKRPDGSVFADHRADPANAADPESIRVHRPSGHLVWTSEGDRDVAPARAPVLVDPHIWEIERDGRFVRAFAIPPKVRAAAESRGIRRNLAFEGLAFSPDYRRLFVALENALLQDGPAATLASGSPSRILEYDFASGALVRETVVDVSPIPVAPLKLGGFADNGIAEILAIDERRLLVLERSYALGIGNTIRLFDVDLGAGSNVAALDALAGQSYVPAPKRRVIDFAELNVRLDNFEGMTWGPRLPNGNRTLIVVSDDNFNPQQATLFFAFEVLER